MSHLGFLSFETVAVGVSSIAQQKDENKNDHEGMGMNENETCTEHWNVSVVATVIFPHGPQLNKYFKSQTTTSGFC